MDQAAKIGHEPGRARRILLAAERSFIAAEEENGQLIGSISKATAKVQVLVLVQVPRW